MLISLPHDQHAILKADARRLQDRPASCLPVYRCGRPFNRPVSLEVTGDEKWCWGQFSLYAQSYSMAILCHQTVARFAGSFSTSFFPLQF